MIVVGGLERRAYLYALGWLISCPLGHAFAEARALRKVHILKDYDPQDVVVAVKRIHHSGQQSKVGQPNDRWFPRRYGTEALNQPD